jgi:hypothetical protein
LLFRKENIWIQIEYPNKKEKTTILKMNRKNIEAHLKIHKNKEQSKQNNK